jgi:hypothetical protein
MAVEDKFSGAKNTFTLFFAYLNAVAQEIGMEQAAALSTKVDEAMGAAQGKMIKEQAGIEQFDAKAAALLARNAIEEGFGITSEVTEESPQRVAFKIGRCPVFEAAEAAGLDVKNIEALCHDGPLKYMNAMVKQLNPNLSYQLRKFRSGADDYCEEAIALSK